MSPPGLDGRFSGRVGAFALDVALSLPASGLTALIGPSGCGKTTLLRCIAGLTRLPGALTVGGEVWQDETRFVPPHRRAVGMVFQDASLLAHLSVQGNLDYARKRAGQGKTVAYDELIGMLGLVPLLGRGVAALSGGERQRVALARALLTQPRLLLLDEPLSSLDPASKAEIAPYLNRLHRSLAIPVLYVTHDLSEVARLADRVLVMREGRIIETRENAKRAADQAALALAALEDSEIRSLALAALEAGLKP
jgi:molybdate transport system ATP-binding protein